MVLTSEVHPIPTSTKQHSANLAQQCSSDNACTQESKQCLSTMSAACTPSQLHLLNSTISVHHLELKRCLWHMHTLLSHDRSPWGAYKPRYKCDLISQAQPIEKRGILGTCNSPQTIEGSPAIAPQHNLRSQTPVSCITVQAHSSLARANARAVAAVSHDGWSHKLSRKQCNKPCCHVQLRPRQNGGQDMCDSNRPLQ